MKRQKLFHKLTFDPNHTLFKAYSCKIEVKYASGLDYWVVIVLGKIIPLSYSCILNWYRKPMVVMAKSLDHAQAVVHETLKGTFVGKDCT